MSRNGVLYACGIRGSWRCSSSPSSPPDVEQQQRWWWHEDRPASPEDEDARYETQDKPHFEGGRRPVRGLRSALQQRRPGRRKAAEPGRGGPDAGREGPRRRPGRLGIGGRHRRKGQAQNVPVISYDRLIKTAKSTTTSRSTTSEVGELQAETLAKKLKEDGNATGPIVMINGSPTDNNAGRSRKARTA